ncbi:adenylate kinase [Bacillus sp. CGMCC 1.16541]|uniref:adenylate kinase n=1 Tax=Bacillus sp. CGMCC 1.16541 TaxID=2185143 RepID=UPI001EF636DC|nr:adenylate kinase [Bacillus sp. CGMCC 1.16541]
MNKGMNRKQFEAKLNDNYSGAVTPLTNYINERAVMVFQCKECQLKFFGKPSHMVGKEHQRHLCHHPYGDRNGTRVQHIIGKHKVKKKQQPVNLEQLNEMIWNDYSYKQIAEKLTVNPKLIKDYFKSEGLI